MIEIVTLICSKTVESGHDVVLKNDFKVFENCYNNNSRKKKIAEILLIKKLKPSLTFKKSQLNNF